jgi:hypothetical protein
MRKMIFPVLVFYGLSLSSLWAATPQLPRVRIVYSSISSIFAGFWAAKETGALKNTACMASCFTSARAASPSRR